MLLNNKESKRAEGDTSCSKEGGITSASTLFSYKMEGILERGGFETAHRFVGKVAIRDS